MRKSLCFKIDLFYFTVLTIINLFLLSISYELWLAGETSQLHVFNLNTMKLIGIYSHGLNPTQQINSNSFILNSLKAQSGTAKFAISVQPNDSVVLMKTDGLFMWSYIYPSEFKPHFPYLFSKFVTST